MHGCGIFTRFAVNISGCVRPLANPCDSYTGGAHSNPTAPIHQKSSNQGSLEIFINNAHLNGTKQHKGSRCP